MERSWKTDVDSFYDFLAVILGKILTQLNSQELLSL